MAIVKCRECGSEISNKAITCPKCGAKRTKGLSFTTWAALIFIATIVFNLMSTDQGEPKQSQISQPPPSAEKDVKLTTGQATTPPTNKLIPYKYLNAEEMGDIKLSLDIEVPLVDGRPPNESELGALSHYLVKKEREHERTFVAFLLPGMEIGAGAYATAHHNPEMEVKIMTFMLAQYPQYKKFAE